MPYIGRGPQQSGAFRIIDDISGDFNGVLTSFALEVGNAALTVGLPETLLIAVDGVLQEAGTAYTISGSNIVFTAPPLAEATFWGVELGDVGGLADSAVKQAANDDTTKVATTSWVQDELDGYAADTATFTNKTFDVEATGNSVSNIDVANLKSGVLDIDLADAAGTDTTLASAKAIKTQLDLKATLVSPALTGTPTSTTQSAGNNSTRIATTAYVDNLQTGIDWQTGSIKTANFTAVAGEGYLVNTTSAAVTATLPAGTAGNIIAITDYAGTAGTNNITISPNGSEKIHGVDSKVLSTNRDSVQLVYIDGTQGWLDVWGVQDEPFSLPVAASGGSESTVSGYRVHVFTSASTNFVVTTGGTVEYFIVAGGGGGAGWSGGGGGAGGVLTGSTTVSAQTYSITVGAGGAGGAGMSSGSQGNASSALSVSTVGGGYGGFTTGGNGGSGGGGGASSSAGGSGTTNQGYDGGDGSGNAHPYGHGAGGGAGQEGANHTTGIGGYGVENTWEATNYWYAGGGGGGAHIGTGTNWSDGGRGGGGGGSGYSQQGDAGADGRNAGGTPSGTGNGGHGGANTGSGGGGSAGGNHTGGAGGSGIVIIRYAV